VKVIIEHHPHFHTAANEGATRTRTPPSHLISQISHLFRLSNFFIVLTTSTTLWQNFQRNGLLAFVCFLQLED
jgi:hypothetical protein